MARLTSDGLRKNLTVPIGSSEGTAETSILVGLGKAIHNDGIRLNPGAGNDNQVNLFQVTGTIKVRELLLIVTTMTDTTKFDNVAFKADSAGGTVDITTLSAAGARACCEGTILARTNISTSPITVAVPSANVLVVDPALSEIYTPFTLVQETGGVASYILFEYDADAATDLIIDAHCLWSPISDDGLLEIV